MAMWTPQTERNVNEKKHVMDFESERNAEGSEVRRHRHHRRRLRCRRYRMFILCGLDEIHCTICSEETNSAQFNFVAEIRREK